MKKTLVLLIAILVLCGVIYGSTGFFVVQPIGSLPEGTTIWYLRNDINLPFISSPDSISLEKTGSVSLLSRGVILGEVGSLVSERRIVKLPYMEFLYLISTGGAQFNS